MANSDEKISKFVQAITEYAEEQRQKIHQEVEDFKAERLKQAEKEVLVDAYRLIQKEQTELRSNMSREMSLREMAARQKLLARRKEMTDAIFSDARQKLADYAKTAAYREKLCSSLTEMAAILPAEGTVYSVSPADADKIAGLEAVCPKGSSIRTADDIQLGGLRGENAAAGIITDDTLDTRLELQREWFTKHSGLTVE